MFMQLEIENLNSTSEVLINIDHISSINSNVVKLSNQDIITLTKESLEKLLNCVYKSDDESLPIPTQHKPSELGAFLTQLHNLLGGRGEAKLTTDRKARLTTRLKDFSREELIIAATNLGSDEYMQGANDSAKRWGTIDYLLRTSANVNKWLEEQPEKKQKGMF